jgi:hypothetical protein
MGSSGLTVGISRIGDFAIFEPVSPFLTFFGRKNEKMYFLQQQKKVPRDILETHFVSKFGEDI